MECKYEKIAICVGFVGLLLILLCTAGISLQFRATQSELGKARTELEYATEYNNSITARVERLQARIEQLQSGIDRCTELTIEARRTIGETGSTIKQIREEVEKLEDYVYCIECELASISTDDSNSSGGI